MKKKIIIIYLTVFSFVLFQSCKKNTAEDIEQNVVVNKNSDIPANNEARAKFAIILAKAIKKDQDLRAFLKEESLKQFDNDYDVLYQMVRDKRINGQETIREKLIRYGATGTQLDSIENQLPLLTIFVPTLPDFSPEKWDAINDIPVVAVAKSNENKITLYNDSGNSLLLEPNQFPAAAVLVIKDNERLVVNGGASDASKTVMVESNNKQLVFSRGGLSYTFAAEAFNGIHKKISTERYAFSNDIDQVNIDAYNSGNEWHRDYVYYGLTSNNTKGEFRNNYSEYITSFKFLRSDALGIISDQDEDPKANYTFGGGRAGSKIVNIPMWTEGSFEFWITVLINSRTGTGPQNTYVMSAKPSELFNVEYRLVKEVKNTFLNIDIKEYAITSINPIEFKPNIRLVPWDLQNYGTAWKFIVYEKDNAQNDSKTYENETTYAANFGIEFGVEKKWGAKFGGSMTTRNKASHTVTTTLNSDFLGEAIVSFDQPIITGQHLDNQGRLVYSTFETPSGNVFSLTVEPKRIF